MKKISLYLVFIALVFSCNKNVSPKLEVETNEVVLLKVDFLTNVFEGGKKMEFSKSSDFTISSTYRQPGDFGDVQLYYKELGEKLFDGTIIWMGTGEMTYPTDMNEANSFSTTDDLSLPDDDMFKKVMYDEFAYYPDTIKYSKIWNAISNLTLVNQYRKSNPEGKINLFLYTPSVGVGNPEEWDWIVILKN